MSRAESRISPITARLSPPGTDSARQDRKPMPGEQPLAAAHIFGGSFLFEGPKLILDGLFGAK